MWKISRRAFIRQTTIATGAMTLGAKADAQRTKPFAEGTYVDIHTHVTQRWGANREFTAPMLVDWMDRHDVARAVVLPLVMPESWDHPLSTEFVLRSTEKHRDRLIPFCGIDPRTTNLSSYERKVAQLQMFKDSGCKGFGEYKPGTAMNDPRSIELFNACAEVGLPILFHLDTVRNTDEPGLPGLAEVLETVPNGTFIGHAQGWWASISGGLTKAELQQYPKGKVRPGGALDYLFKTYPNIYGDLSAGSGANAISRDREFGREFVIRNADRLLFGTDVLKPGQDIPQFDLYESLDLPKKVQRKVFWENATRLLGLT